MLHMYFDFVVQKKINILDMIDPFTTMSNDNVIVISQKMAHFHYA